ncbi:hypothetical protein OAX78_00365 [Planctomycetota bacterium]|nr:hypothetical protein [Planctomycetota bacterium]
MTPEQLEAIHRAKTSGEAPKALAKRLGLHRKAVDEALAKVDPPAWTGREPRIPIFVIGALLILILGGWAYGHNITGEWHYDDTQTVRNNTAIRTLKLSLEDGARSDSSTIERWRHFRKALTPTAAAIYDFNLYRMVTYWTYAWSFYSTGGTNDAKYFPGWHTFNNRVHYINGLLVFWLAYVTLTSPLFRRSKNAVRYPALVALIAALVFELHPLQTQSVTYIAQRAESLCGMFYLLSLGCYAMARVRSLDDRRGRTPWITPLVLSLALVALGALALAGRVGQVFGMKGFLWSAGLVLVATAGALIALVKTGRDTRLHAVCMAGTFLFLLLAVQSKEIGATLPMAILLWDLCFVPNRDLLAPEEIAAPQRSRLAWLRRLRYTAPWVGVLVAGVLAFLFLGGANIAGKLLAEGVGQGGTTLKTISIGEYVGTESNVIWTYLRLFLLPFNQQLDYDYPVVGQSSGAMAVMALSLPALIALGVFLVTRQGRRLRLLGFAVAFSLLILAPTSSVIVLEDVIYEHRVYLPLFATALVLAVFLERVARLWIPEKFQLPALVGAGVVLCAVLLPMTHARNSVWETELALWTDSSLKAPNKPRVWTNLGLACQANEPYEYLIRTPNGDDVTMRGKKTDLVGGLVLIQRTDVHALEQEPFLVARNFVVKETDLGTGVERAIAAFERSLAIDPNYTKALNNLSLCRISQGHRLQAQAKVLARLEVDFAQRAQAGSREAAELAHACRQQVREELYRQADDLFMQADEALARVLTVRDDDWLVMANLGTLHYRYTGDLVKAHDYALTAAEMDGMPPVQWVMAGHICMTQGDENYREAVQTGLGNPIEYARPHWEEAIVCYEQFLLATREEADQFAGAAADAETGRRKAEASLAGIRDPTQRDAPPGRDSGGGPGIPGPGQHGPGDGHNH